MIPKKPEMIEFEKLEIKDLIKRYAESLGKINLEVLNLSSDLLNRKFSNIENTGTLSCIELVGHIADAEIVVTHRMRRAVAENKPVLAIWDENEFLKNGLYSGNSASEYIELIKVTRNFTSQWLSKLNEKNFSRLAIHPERGEISMKSILVYIAWHLEQHAWFLDRKLDMISKK